MTTSPRRLRQEIGLVLLITFGMSGLRSLFRLIDSLTTAPLNQQSVTLNQQLSDSPWLDIALQLCSAGVLIGWGLLAVYVLEGDGIRLMRLKITDWFSGAGLAALIGIPGLFFYLGAVHFGLSKQVVPSTIETWYETPILLLWSAANAFAEEIVVVWWLITRLRQLRWSVPAAVVTSSVLRGSYHLYQGVSAGFGNIIMGIIFGYFYARTRKVWPLVIAHLLIDAVAFIGYSYVTL